MNKANGRRMQVDLVEMARQARLRAEQAAKDAAALEKQVKLARGTQRNVTPPGNVLVKPSHGPYWVGDEGPTHELMTTIEKMARERPWLFRDMVEATGAGENRIKGVIMRLQREGINITDVAPEGSTKALWFIPSEALLARLKRARRPTARK